MKEIKHINTIKINQSINKKKLKEMKIQIEYKMVSQLSFRIPYNSQCMRVGRCLKDTIENLPW